MTEERKHPPSDDANWLEAALLLAAAELSAHRALASAEQERLARAHAEALSQVSAARAAAQKREAEHEKDLQELHVRMQGALGERADTWQRVVTALQDRARAATVEQGRVQAAQERAASAERDASEARAQARALLEAKEHFEKRLLAIEESFVDTAARLRHASETSQRSATERDDLRSALGAADGRIAELLQGKQEQDSRLADSAQSLSEERQALAEAQTELEQHRVRVVELLQTSAALEQTRVALAAELAEARARGESAQAAERFAAAEAERSSAELLALRQERDQASQQLRAALAESQSAQVELAALRVEHAQATQELEEHKTTRWAMLDNEKQRGVKLKAEIARLSAELDGLRTQLAEAHVEQDLMREELTSTLSARGSPSARPGRSSTLAGFRADRPTVPMPELEAARQAPAPPPAAPREEPARPRVGTSYSVNQVQEEQIFIPTRGPAKGPGDGPKGTR